MLCNIHHLRELKRAWKQDRRQQAKQMHQLLLEINKAVDEAGGSLSLEAADTYLQRYRDALQATEKECLPPDENQRTKDAAAG